MKQIILALAIGFIAMGCARSGQNEELSPNFVGTWLLIEKIEGLGVWKKVSKENQYAYTFKSDNTFTTTKFEDCQQGTYEIVNDTLKLNFTCPNFEPFGILNNPLTEIMEIKNGQLILSPTYFNCDEGCSEKFQKMSNK